MARKKKDQVRVRDDFKSLSGYERAAVVLLSLDEEAAQSIMQRLDEEEIREITRAMADLGSVTSNLVEELITSFTDRFSDEARGVIGSASQAKRLLSGIMDEQDVDSFLLDLDGPDGRTMWEKISNVSEIPLANYLANEHPQIVAVILSKVASDSAARVLELLDRSFAEDVIARMLTIGVISPDVISDIERTLRSEFIGAYMKSGGPDQFSRLAEIFNRTEEGMTREMLAYLETVDVDSANKIRDLMFTFDDLIRLDRGSLNALIQAVETETWALALKGTEQSFRDNVINCLSERAGRLLVDAIEELGAVRASEVTESRSKIMIAAKGLEERGLLILPSSEDEGAMIE